MEMVRMTEAELQQGFRALADRARREPVTITTPDGRDEFVVLSAEEYARLKRRDRRVGLTEELPEEWVEAVRNAKVPDEFAALDAELKQLARAAARARSGPRSSAIAICGTASTWRGARKARKIVPARSWRRYARPMTPAAGRGAA